MRIIYFDGVCNLCNGFVDFVIQRDKQRIFQFAPLQGQSAQRNLNQQDLGLDSVVLFKQGKVYKKSQAVIQILTELGPGYKALAAVGRFFPQSFLNFIYDFVAKNRYVLFGQKSTCRLPSPEERKLFLD